MADRPRREPYAGAGIGSFPWHERKTVSDVPESEQLYLRGRALGWETHDQSAWSERVAVTRPDVVQVAAGVLSNFVTNGNELHAAYIAFELYNAGMLVMPEKLPSWEALR